MRASQEEATGYEDVRGCMRRGWWWVGMSLGTRKPAETVKVCILRHGDLFQNYVTLDRCCVTTNTLLSFLKR